MSTFPQSLEEAIKQAKECTENALKDGCKLVQIELVIPEIALQAQNLALDFASLFANYDSRLKILFADTGAAALARRDWGEVSFKVSDLGSRRTPVDMKISPEDEAFLVVSPSSVEIEQVEKLCNIAGERPVVLLIPQLEDVAIVGIGLAARQLRERFINTIVSAYYFRPVEGGAVLHCYPDAWEVWLEKEDGYKLIAKEAEKPMGEKLDRILGKVEAASEQENMTPVARKTGLLSGLQSFLRALSN